MPQSPASPLGAVPVQLQGDLLEANPKLMGSEFDGSGWESLGIKGAGSYENSQEDLKPQELARLLLAGARALLWLLSSPAREMGQKSCSAHRGGFLGE